MSSYTGTIISSDSHVIEPWDLWIQRVGKAFKDRAPKLERGEDGDRLVLEEVAMPPIGMVAGVFRSDSEVRRQGRWEEDVPPSAYDPDARLAELDTDGITGEVLFPTLGLNLYTVEDLTFKWELFRAYNDWLAEFCGSHPDRYKGVAMLAHEDIELAVAEVARVAKLGLSGVMVPTFAGADFPPYHHPIYGPLWNAAVEHGLPVHMHSSTTRDKAKELHKNYGNGRNPMSSVLKSGDVARVLLEMIWGAVFDRHPDLMFISAENEAGWAPHLLDRSDYEFNRYQSVPRVGFEQNCRDLPSMYWKRNIKATFMRDLVAVQTHNLIGTETLMFQTDFPHGVSTYPNSRKMIDELFAGIDEETRDMIVFRNASQLYGF